jgi:uncharacterized iron-regulated protein
MSRESPVKLHRSRRDGILVFFLVLLDLALVLLPGRGVCQAQILRLADGNLVTLPEMVKDLRRARVVLVGEEHDNPNHHRAQLQIIRVLAASGARVTLGLEMFRADSQPALDRWVAGELDYREFLRVYRDNWSDSEQYNEIFKQARANKWPMLGLNLSRQIVNQVAKKGFASLSEEQLEQLPVVQCLVDETYMRFIRRALGQHRLPDDAFVNFCEAQMLWDMVMARNLSTYLTGHPKATVVVLTGFGHAWKHAIPAQLQKLGVSNWRVVLPHMPGVIDSESVSAKDLDYLLLEVASGPLH